MTLKNKIFILIFIYLLAAGVGYSFGLSLFTVAIPPLVLLGLFVLLLFTIAIIIGCLDPEDVNGDDDDFED